VGGNASFSVTATGNPAPSYQWTFGGITIPGATASTYTVNGAQPSNGGNYKVVVTNSVSSVTSRAAALTVDDPPAITTQPISRTVAVGGKATFTIVASGVPIPTYQWSLNGAPILGATRASLTLTGVAAADAGTYTAKATNTFGFATSNGAVLTVHSAPSITTQPASQATTVGGSAAFTVVATGVPAPTYQWSLGGIAITGATASTYSVVSAQASDAGSYSVVVTNSLGSVLSSAAVLTVDAAAAITVQPMSQSVVAGNDPTFTVVATGIPVPTYQWALNTTPIVGATKASLTLVNVKAANAGTYTVTVTNTGGSVVSTGAILTVDVPPSITTQPTSRTVSPGAHTTFTVVAAGSQTLTYQWYFDGTLIPGATASTYTVTNAQPANAGDYAVTVRNSASVATSHNAILKVN
jgi:hypothetical protein